MTNKEKEIKLIELRANNISHRKIAEILNISKNTSMTWSNKHKLEIAEKQAEQFGELFQSYGIYKQSMIQELGETLLKINNQLEDKDFSDIPTLKLLDFKLKIMEQLNKEFIDPEIYLKTKKQEFREIEL